MATYLLELLYAPLSPQKALDKLTRLGSPSPAPLSKSPSHASTTSSRLRQARNVQPPAPREQGASGSETEREDTSVNTFSSHSQSSSSPASSSQRPFTPPTHTTASKTNSPYSQLRNGSTPGSPSSARRRLRGSGESDLSDSPSGRRRKRASMATLSTTQDYEEDEQVNHSYFSATSSPGRDRQRNDRATARDITASALAAVASSRRSPISTRRRAALPREFREELSTGETGSVVSDARTRHSEDVDNRLNRVRLRTRLRFHAVLINCLAVPGSYHAISLQRRRSIRHTSRDATHWWTVPTSDSGSS